MRRIYLDHAATSPLLPEAREAMLPWLDSGNPSSLHAEGRRAKAALDEARETLSEALGCLFAEVLFTSGGTEAANLALIGAAIGNSDSRRRRILISSAEHHCVLGTRPTLEALGYSVELIPVDRVARVDLGALEDQLGDDVLVVSAMHANNELGTLNPVPEIGELAHRHGALYHCDAVQTFGKHLPGEAKLAHLPADLLTISAHKIGGPKAVGAIFIRAGVKLKPLVAGGGQEREVRGGTENVAGIVGLAAATRVSLSRAFEPEASKPRDLFLAALVGAGFVPSVSDICLETGIFPATSRDANGVTSNSEGLDGSVPAYPGSGSTALSIPDGVPAVLPSHAHVRLPGIDAETMLIRLDREGIAASSGAACSSGSIEPSHVLLACGYSAQEAKEGLRFTFGPETTLEDAEEAARRVVNSAEMVSSVRQP